MTTLLLAALVFGVAAGGGGAGIQYWLKHRERLDDRIKRILVEALNQMETQDTPTRPGD